MIAFGWLDLCSWVDRSSTVLIKKLARNDCSWADSTQHHQSGLYVPRDVQRDGFFPELANTNRDKPHIFDRWFVTYWPASDEIKRSRLKHYSNKGSEFHFTRVPLESFADLTPASLLVGGKLKVPLDEAWYWFVVVDAASDTAEHLESSLDLAADFQCAIFDPGAILGEALDEGVYLIGELETALRRGTLDALVAKFAKMPAPKEFAFRSQNEWLVSHHRRDLNPWEIENPGDAIMEISRDIEFRIYRRAELQLRAAQVLQVLHGGPEELAGKIVHRFRQLDSIFMSAAQTRKSRAGTSFELHVDRVLADGHIQHESQAILRRRRPDFVLPGVDLLRNTQRGYVDALILSLKTTLRERWKQLSLEKFRCEVLLATVDDRVSASAITDMEKNGIRLVVPESLKIAKETCYGKSSAVITFRQFFDDEIAKKRPALRAG